MKQLYIAPSITSLNSSKIYFLKNQATCNRDIILDGQNLAVATVDADGNVSACGSPTESDRVEFCLDGPPLPLSQLQELIVRGSLDEEMQLESCNYGADNITDCPGTEYTCFGANSWEDFQCINIHCADGTLLSQCPDTTCNIITNGP